MKPLAVHALLTLSDLEAAVANDLLNILRQLFIRLLLHFFQAFLVG